MAHGFLAAQGGAIGLGFCEPGGAQAAAGVMEEAQARGCRIVLPQDLIAAQDREGKGARSVPALRVPADLMGLDIGPQSVAQAGDEIAQARTIIWNGPMGAFETEGFAQGSFGIARHIAARMAQGGAVAVAGGGETAAVIGRAGAQRGFSHISMAGGAFLEWLARGRPLPALAALEEARSGQRRRGHARSA